MCMNVLLHVCVYITCAVPAEARRSLEAAVWVLLKQEFGFNVLMETGIWPILLSLLGDLSKCFVFDSFIHACNVSWSRSFPGPLQ